MIETLTTERLVLRPWVESDAAAMVRILSIEDVYRWLGDSPEPLTDEARAREVIAKLAARAEVDPFDAFRAIEVRATGEVVGCVLLARLERKNDGGYVGEHEIGWWLHPDAWGQGYAVEAARATLGHAFAHGLDQVWCGMLTDNVQSRRVAEKLGLPFLGIQEDPWYEDEGPLFHVDAAAWLTRN